MIFINKREKQFRIDDNIDKIDPRVLEIERIAEINYLKQKQTEQKHMKQKEKESMIQEMRERSDQFKEQLLDQKIQESQIRYLREHFKDSNKEEQNSQIQNANKYNYNYQQNQFDKTNNNFQPIKYIDDFSISSNKPRNEQINNNIINNHNLGDSTQSNYFNSSFKSNLSSSSQNKNNNNREKISFRSKSNVFDPQNRMNSTTIKLIPFSNKIKNEQFNIQHENKSINLSNSHKKVNDELLEEYEQDYSKLILQAKYLIIQNHLLEAETMLENLILKIPFHSDCLYLLGDTKRIIGKYKESEIILKKCMEQENYSPFVYKALAETYCAIQQYQETVFYMKKYLLFKIFSLNHFIQQKDDDEALEVLGQSLLKLGDNLEASVCFNKALEINKDKLEYYLHRSQVNDLLGLRELSQRDYAYFIKNKQHYLQILSTKAQQLKSQGKVLESQKKLQLLQELIPIN